MTCKDRSQIINIIRNMIKVVMLKLGYIVVFSPSVHKYTVCISRQTFPIFCIIGKHQIAYLSLNFPATGLRIKSKTNKNNGKRGKTVRPEIMFMYIF